MTPVLPAPGSRPTPRLKIVISSSLANLAAPLSTLITGPLLARALGPEGRGLVAALLSPIALAGLMFTLGVPDALTYFVAAGKLSARQSRQLAALGGLLCAIVACATLFLSAPYLFHNQPSLIVPFNWLILSLPLTLLFSAWRGLAQGRQLFSAINRERVSSAILRLLVLAALLAFHILTPLNAVWTTVVTALAGSLFLLPALRSNHPVHTHPQSLRPVATYAGAAAVATLGGLLVIRLDQVLMVSLTSHAELAYYAVAATLAEIPLAIVDACRSVAFTLAAERDDLAIIARFSRLTLLTMSAACLAAALVTPFAVPLLFGKVFSPAIPMAEILLIGTVFRAVAAVIGAGLMTAGQSWGRSAIQLAGAALTALLIFALVPHWGGLGAAFVTTLTYATLAAASLHLFTRSSQLTWAACLLPTPTDLRDLRQATIHLLKPLSRPI